ncbi:MAG TPA: MBL fold metallo-hydrolase [Candidatus Nanoarchaeia archaeon]|nr:MBL fold metallo-hydrolase [Candidatus Nanoarchaeia archaeon]
MDRIVFLGTGSQSVVRAKVARLTGGIVVKTGDNQLVIDPGPGCLQAAQLAGINIRETTALLVSHCHIGHCNDVNAVIDAMTYSGLDRQGVLICSAALVQGAEDIKPYVTEFHMNCVEKVLVLRPEQRVGVNDIEVQALATRHHDSHALGFKIMTDSYTLSYTGDTAFFSGMDQMYKGSDVMILNVVSPKGVQSRGNLNAEDAVNIINKVNPKLAILTHFGAKMLEADPIYEAREIQKQTNSQIIAAKDGMSIAPASYSALMKQKRLGGF